MEEESEATRETRTRRLAKKQGLLLRKSRKRLWGDERHYYLVDPETGGMVSSIGVQGGMLTLEEAGRYLTRESGG